MAVCIQIPSTDHSSQKQKCPKSSILDEIMGEFHKRYCGEHCGWCTGKPSTLVREEEDGRLHTSVRCARLDSRIVRGYHQTDESCARSILRDGFLRGPEGMAGAGIYFAAYEEDTHHKAHKHGVILVADVKVCATCSIYRAHSLQSSCQKKSTISCRPATVTRCKLDSIFALLCFWTRAH